MLRSKRKIAQLCTDRFGFPANISHDRVILGYVESAGREARVVEGTAERRDVVLTDAERAAN